MNGERPYPAQWTMTREGENRRLPSESPSSAEDPLRRPRPARCEARCLLRRRPAPLGRPLPQVAIRAHRIPAHHPDESRTPQTDGQSSASRRLHCQGDRGCEHLAPFGPLHRTRTHHRAHCHSTHARTRHRAHCYSTRTHHRAHSHSRTHPRTRRGTRTRTHPRTRTNSIARPAVQRREESRFRLDVEPRRDHRSHRSGGERLGSQVQRARVGRPDLPAPHPIAELATKPMISGGDEVWMSTKFLLPSDFPSSGVKWIQPAEIYGPPFAGSPSWSVKASSFSDPYRDFICWQRNAATTAGTYHGRCRLSATVGYTSFSMSDSHLTVGSRCGSTATP